MSAEDQIRAKIGQTVSMVVESPSACPTSPQVQTYTGSIIKSEYWDPAETFRITGTPEFPTRVVRYDRVKSIDGVKAVQPKKGESQLVRITSSKGDKQYVVVLNPNGTYKCDCQGFQIRKTCRHIGEAMEKVNWSV